MLVLVLCYSGIGLIVAGISEHVVGDKIEQEFPLWKRVLVTMIYWPMFIYQVLRRAITGR